MLKALNIRTNYPLSDERYARLTKESEMNLYKFLLGVEHTSPHQLTDIVDDAWFNYKEGGRLVFTDDIKCRDFDGAARIEARLLILPHGIEIVPRIKLFT
jgi:hypothetical protein